MDIFLTLAFLFYIGSLVGWGIEVLFRRFFSSANPQRRWINPGFLTGPYLPLYGFSLCALYLLAQMEGFLPISNLVLRKLALFALMALVVTAVEYITGLIFIKGLHTKLWDYSSQWGNIGGIVCPKFTFFWAVLSALYYFLVHPHILSALEWLSNNLAFSFVIGLFYGVLLVDAADAIQLAAKIRAFADGHEIVVKYEDLKAHIRDSKEKAREKARFLFSMHSRMPLAEQLERYFEKHRESFEKQRSELREKRKKKSE